MNWLLPVLSATVAFIVTLAFGRVFIPIMRKKEIGQKILEIGPKWHMSKQGTPTMGGVLFIVGICASVIVSELGISVVHDTGRSPIAIMIFLFALAFGVIGFIDDYVKVAKKRNLGLTAPQKLFLQLAVSLTFVSLLRLIGVLSPDLYIPFANLTVRLPWALYTLLSVLFITGIVNAVNFTDGVDGLLSSVTLPIMVFFTVAAAVKCSEGVSIVSAASTGALIGFLVYNFNPARIFMGDTGSLFLGGLVCGVAFALNIPIIILIVGAIYIVEILSVVIQVSFFKITGGKRLFRMAPIHHHFEMGGWSEKKICGVFSGITFLLVIVSFIALFSIYTI
ncbi:MAG: phospho-N-acetylmuramoyl-pentapeptide-transferase [Clostridiales bacterium]|jgi:phospho-N-acetylmuramoyl-pentapeptide-transferase|nr:phospho-N-acetylmuramoyl-pentapeptide-transferase [Clostridiales bacterium]